MTDDEVRRWIDGPRLTQSGRIAEDNRTIEERIESLESYAEMYRDNVAGENAQKIVDQMKRDLHKVKIGKSELDKQKAYAVTEVMESKGISGEPGHGPADKIRGFLGLPPVKKRDGGRKTKKNSKKTRRLRRRTHKRLL